MNLEPIPSHKGSVTWFLSLASPKSTPTPSFYVTWKVWLIFIHLHLLYLYIHLPLCSTKKYWKVITKRDIQWCLVGPYLLCVGLELKLELVFELGLGPLPLDLTLDNVIDNIEKGVSTRNSLNNSCEMTTFVSQVEPKNCDEALQDSNWILAM